MKYLGYKFEEMTTIELFAEPAAALVLCLDVLQLYNLGNGALEA
jgi:hypothetical protein